MTPEYTASNRQEWRSWLEKHHGQASEVWLVYFKKSSGKPSVSYAESLEEAICFGWIDGLIKKIDAHRYTHRFTPRKTGSRWSPRNIEIAKRMIREGKMTPAGQQAFDQRMLYDEEILEARADREPDMPDDFDTALRANNLAWTYFNALAPGYRKQYINWISSAKRPETRQRRIAEAIEQLQANQKLGMK